MAEQEKKPRSRRLQRAVRERMKATGEKYTQALRALLDEREARGE